MRNYYLRRLVRIESPYFIVKTALFALYIFSDAGSFTRYAPHYAASMGYLHNLLFPEHPGLNAVPC